MEEKLLPTDEQRNSWDKSTPGEDATKTIDMATKDLEPVFLRARLKQLWKKFMYAVL